MKLLKILAGITVIISATMLCACNEKEIEIQEQNSQNEEVNLIEPAQDNSTIEEVKELNSDKNEELSAGEESTKMEEEESKLEEAQELVIDESARYGAINNPIKLNDYGDVELYCAKTDDYRINKIKVLGESDKNTKELVDHINDNYFVFEIDEEQFDVIATEIEIDLVDFPTSTYGKDRFMPTYDIRSLDDSSNFGKVHLISSFFKSVKADAEDVSYHEGDKAHVTLVYALPKGYKGKYFITFENDYKNVDARYTYFLMER